MSLMLPGILNFYSLRPQLKFLFLRKVSLLLQTPLLHHCFEYLPFPVLHRWDLNLYPCHLMSPSSSDTTHAKPTRSGFRSRSHSKASFSMWTALGKRLFIIYFIVVQAPGMQESFRSTKGNLAHGRFPGPIPAAYDFLSRGNKSVIRWHLHSLFLPVLLFHKK